MGRLQTDILQCRWMTWEFLQDCMERFMVKTILREFRNQGLLWKDLEPVKGDVVRRFVHEILHLNVKLGIDSSDDYRGKSMLDYDQRTTKEEWHIDHEGNKEWIKASRDRIQRLKEGVASEVSDDESEVATGSIHIGTFHQREDEGKNVMSEKCDWSKCLFGGSHEVAVPDKLFKGPWTKEKLSFLEAVVEGGAFVNSERLEILAAQSLMRLRLDPRWQALLLD
ncbi:MAG: hypothetical protein Q9218_002944 [Villophora microphyllina]